MSKTTCALVASALVLIVGCPFVQFSSDDAVTGRTLPGDQTTLTASARVSASLATDTTLKRIAPQDVEKVLVQITWDDGQTPTVEMFETMSDYYELIVENLPSGIPCAISIKAFDEDGATIYSGGASGVIFSDDEMLDVAVNLTAADNGVDDGAAPRVTIALRPSTDIPAGMVVDLTLGVSDPDDTELAYELSSSGDGSFDAPSGTITLAAGFGKIDVRYTTPTQVGAAEVTMHVTDSTGLTAIFSFTLSIVEPPDETLPGAGHVVSNFPPTIRGVRASQAEDVALIELFAEAEDESPAPDLTYTWDADGAPYATGNPIIHQRDVGVVTLTLTVTDPRGAATTMNFDLDTAATLAAELPVSNYAPRIAAAFMSDQDVSFGDEVTLLIYANDPDLDDLEADWQTDHGSIASTTATTEGDLHVFRAVWEADVNPGLAHVTITVSDPDSATATYTFDIKQILGMVGIHADSGNDQEAFVAGSVILNAGGSFSDDGVIDRYLWQQVGGPSSTIVSPEAEITEVLLTTLGTYLYELTVWNVNSSDTDTVETLVIDPTQFTYEDADIDETGIIYLLDTTTDRVRRYDAVAEQFLPSFSTGSGLYRFAVAPAGDQVYVGYNGGRMDVIDTATGEMTFFAAAPSTVLRMAVIDGYIFTIDTSGAWESHSLYSRETGTRTFSDDWRHISNGVAYAPSITRIFTFRDGTSPNDIIRTDVDLENGTLGTDTDSPYHGSYSFRHPMRLFPDETRIAVASGVIFDTSDLTYAGSMGMGYEDMRFLGSRVYVINDFGTRTELTIMDVDFNILESETFDGAPLNLFATTGSLFLITEPSTGRVSIQTVVTED